MVKVVLVFPDFSILFKLAVGAPVTWEWGSAIGDCCVKNRQACPVRECSVGF